MIFRKQYLCGIGLPRSWLQKIPLNHSDMPGFAWDYSETSRVRQGKGYLLKAECTTTSQPQSLAILLIADEIARNFHNEKQIWIYFIAICIATATVSLPHLQLFNVVGLTTEPSKKEVTVYSFDRVNESQTANHRQETVLSGWKVHGCTVSPLPWRSLAFSV